METVVGDQHTYRYRYSAAGRLETVEHDGELTSTYTYDTNGNRLEVDRFGTVETGTYDRQDRLQSYGIRSYEFGAAGDLQSVTDTVTMQTTGYDYDELGNLRSVVLPDGRVVEYEVDASNRRVAKKIDGVTQYGLLYMGQLEPVAMLDASGAVTAVFVYGERSHVPEYIVKNGVTYRYVLDRVGSVKLVVRAHDGTVVQKIEYDEFGRVLADSAPGFQPFGFAGGIYDTDTGLVRFGARDYDAVSGRWQAKDPILFDGGTTNLYEYVGSDPLNGNDPTGLVGPLGFCLTPVGAPICAAAAAEGIEVGALLVGLLLKQCADIYARKKTKEVNCRLFDILAQVGGGWKCLYHCDDGTVRTQFVNNASDCTRTGTFLD